MRAGKAYISSLGTTGLLIASSVLLLLVVGAFVAFDSWPTQAAVAPEEVAIGSAPRPDVVRTRMADRGAAAQRPQRRARSAGSDTARSRGADSGHTGRRVLAALPAPEVGPRHLREPQQPAGAARPGDARPAQYASVPLLPLAVGAGVPAAAEVPTSATLDDVVKRVTGTKPAGGR
jgi:hypothetical protein